MAELVAVAKAFKEQDPDGNGKADTYGFGLAKDFVTGGTVSGAQDMVGLIYGFHAYPGGWLKDASGSLVYGSIQPEMKTALTNLQQMFKDGLIDGEFAIKDSTKVQEDEAAGKVGISFGMMWNSIWPLQASIDKDPNAVWIPLPLVSADDKPALCILSSPVGNWHVVNKNYKNPEALVKMVNLWVELMEGPNAQMTVYGTNPEGKEIFKMSMFRTWIPTQNMDDYLAVKDAIDTKDASKLTGRNPTLLDQVQKFQAGDTKQYGYALVFGPGGSQAICADVYKNNAWVTNEFYGAPTPTMVDKNSTLLKLQNEAFTKIIMGKASIDEFDNYVAQWKQLGGDQITKEVNDWYASHK
jgi:putative aldouronate transport system substrate-binding protein